jgi:hypothetical protein
LNYNPYAPTAAELATNPNLENEDFEFIELTNIGQSPINLLGVHFAAGVDFVFPSLTLAAGETAVVVGNEAAFRARYGQTPRVLGALIDGRLNNAGERIQLADANGAVILEFTYDDDLPWPLEPDGQGPTLTLIDPTTAVSALNNGRQWSASRTPGGSPGRLGSEADLDQNGIVDVADLDLLCSAILAEDANSDLNQDGETDSNDMVFFVESLVRTSMGDVNLDGVFNSADLVEVFAAGEYEDGLAGNSIWADGDWNCDGDFDTGDLVLSFQRGGYVTEARHAQAVDAVMNTRSRRPAAYWR